MARRQCRGGRKRVVKKKRLFHNILLHSNLQLNLKLQRNIFDIFKQKKCGLSHSLKFLSSSELK